MAVKNFLYVNTLHVFGSGTLQIIFYTQIFDKICKALHFVPYLGVVA